MIRAILDTNIYVSYLLPSTQESVITSIVEMAFTGQYTLLLVQEIATEFIARIAQKKYLVERISRHDAEELIAQLSSVAEMLPKATEPFPYVTRDPKDDYLLAYAILGRADYLVTGDDDLLAIGQVEGVRIVTPSEFKAVMQNQSG